MSFVKVQVLQEITIFYFCGTVRQSSSFCQHHVHMQALKHKTGLGVKLQKTGNSAV